MPGKKAEIAGFVDGPNTKGETRINIQESLKATREAQNDAVNKQKIPREYSDHFKNYVDGL